jgi:GDP-mannose 6-dehydrogenase
VGSVTSTLLAEQGNTVVGVDINPAKVDMVVRGSCPVVEAGLPERMAKAVDAGRLSAVSDPARAGEWKVAFVCVATPSGAGGQVETAAVRTVLKQIGGQLRSSGTYAVVAIRSTLHAHLLHQVVIPTLAEAAGAPPGDRYGVAVLPEFLREGTAIADFMNPPFTLIGESDSRAGDVLQDLFKFVDAPTLRMSMAEAVMVKYASNAYHALKVAFANEIGLLCEREGVDGDAVMSAFCQDRKLNVSASYLRPGFAFGGSCLPKDLRALTHHARLLDVDTPLLNAILPSNRSYLELRAQTVLATQRERIGILGMSFKAGTDDLRESPMIAMIETLIGKGKQLAIYDSKVRLAQLTGANRDYIERTIPHIARLIRSSVDEVVSGAELVVIGNADQEFKNVEKLMRPDQLLIDFTIAPKPAALLGGSASSA